MKSDQARRAAITHELDGLLAYRGGEAVRQLVKLLDAIAEDTLADLATVAAANLQFKQGALAQVAHLRRALVDPGPHAMPKP